MKSLICPAHGQSWSRGVFCHSTTFCFTVVMCFTSLLALHFHAFASILIHTDTRLLQIFMLACEPARGWNSSLIESAECWCCLCIMCFRSRWPRSVSFLFYGGVTFGPKDYDAPTISLALPTGMKFTLIQRKPPLAVLHLKSLSPSIHPVWFVNYGCIWWIT